MNVLTLGSRVIGDKVAEELAVAFIGAQFDGVDRHERRFNKVRDIEKRMMGQA